MKLNKLTMWALALALSSCVTAAFADDSSQNDPRAAAYRSAMQLAIDSMQRGPTEVQIAGEATLKVPEGFGFIPAVQARNLLKAMGNHPGEDDQGMIYPLGNENADWFVVVSYEQAGYIKDDDAKSWNANDLLDSIKEGTAETNKERRAQGIPEMEIIGWVEKPSYNAATRRLVWSLSSRDKGAPANEVPGINYNTLMLGREGYISMNMVTDLQAVESLKPTAQLLLSSLDFNAGKRYSDFNASTDKVAAYGLAALVAGVAAKKLGLIALIAAFAVKFAKVIGIGVVAALAGLSKLRGKKAEESESA